MNSGLIRISDEAIVAYFKLLSGDSLAFTGNPRENTRSG
jgi:hypothetical protein